MDSYTVIIEPSTTGYGAYSPDVLGCAAAGDTVEEALALLRETLALHLEDMVASGEPIPTAHGLSFHLRSLGDRPALSDFITSIPVEAVAPPAVEPSTSAEP